MCANMDGSSKKTNEQSAVQHTMRKLLNIGAFGGLFIVLICLCFVVAVDATTSIVAAVAITVVVVAVAIVVVGFSLAQNFLMFQLFCPRSLLKKETFGGFLFHVCKRERLYDIREKK